MVRPRVARGFRRSGVSGLASMYPVSDWSLLCSGPSWVSARVRSHYRTGLNGPFGSPVFASAGKTDPPLSSHPLADLRGYPATRTAGTQALPHGDAPAPAGTHGSD